MTTPKNRKVVRRVKPPSVDYGVLKSLIRDEVELQMKREMKRVIQPLYQVIMSDPTLQNEIHTLPKWAQDLLNESGQVQDTDDHLYDPHFWE